MANPKKRVPENTGGDFFVDSTCIDCDACRQIAAQAAETSFVHTQPVSPADRRPSPSYGCGGPPSRRAVRVQVR
jgi:hypothetical protein